MESINNLSYELLLKYINNAGLNVSICTTIYDNGLESNSIRVGDICVTEETINGRILSGSRSGDVGMVELTPGHFCRCRHITKEE